MGAALAYYTMFSIAPLLLIVISIAGLVFGEEAVRGEIFVQLRGLMGDQGAQAIQGLLESVSEPKIGAASVIIGTILLLIGATTVFSELQDAFDHIWKAPPEGDKETGWFKLIRVRLLSLGIILGIGFLMIVSLVFSAAIAGLGKWWGPLFESLGILEVVNFVFSYILMTVIFALFYKFMPRVKVKWRDVLAGATVTAFLFTVGKLLIGFYIGTSAVASGFGAAGSLVVVLIWVYYSAQIFLLGVEFTQIYSHRHGSRRELPPQAP